ncbi:IS30 family transposase [Streptomyces tirandamycinicus]|uniref:IS30 family transposase n=1 Tax=Streptomyces tirandamycinicus TaxID=2174846 RepID=A0A2S1T334_9ACTN|nr:IS30 family transposase [Streptomyces tirandamycinicus]AWI33034.1 IS30 family transposase [Streptomyces tirandamycinicus]
MGSVTVVARELGVNRNTAFGWARQTGRCSVRLPRRHPRRDEYERLRAEGVAQSVAARRVGVNERTARDWDQGVKKTATTRTYADGRRVDYAAGTVTMGGVTAPSVGLAALDKQLHPRFLTLAEREQIRDLRAAGQSLRAIGRALGRPASTVKREIDTNSGSGGYQPYAAHRAAAARRPRPKERKLLREGRLRRFVQDHLRRRWSPQQICHALRREHPDDESMRVSVETIYQALYFQARGGLKREVQTAIRSGRTRRKPRRDPQRRTPRFTDPMIMISDRPAAVEDRAVPGHWEGDLIIGAGGRSAIATLVERSTRYTMLVHLPGGAHDAETVRDGLVTTIQTLPAHLRGSLTWDQGSEMARHKQFTMATGMPVYFCDPASPWQRGSNENTNGLLRQYFPKGTDLSVHSPEDLEHVAQELNGRPRKTLGWDTPAERLRDLLTT